MSGFLKGKFRGQWSWAQKLDTTSLLFITQQNYLYISRTYIYQKNQSELKFLNWKELKHVMACSVSNMPRTSQRKVQKILQDGFQNQVQEPI